MNYFVQKLNLPRPTFFQDMAESEVKLMQEHTTYWRDLADKGIAIIFAPVLDPKEAWGWLFSNAKMKLRLAPL